MDNTALADLLTTANKTTPPKPEVLARLSKLMADEPAFFNVQAGLTRFDVDRKGKPTTGYGFSAQVEQNPIYELVFVISDLAREGLLPCYLRKLYGLAVAHPEWVGLAAGVLPPLISVASDNSVTISVAGPPKKAGALSSTERSRRAREHKSNK
jgi:hypothetical protein